MNVAHYLSNFSPTSETFIYDLIVELQLHGIKNQVITNTRYNLHSRPFENVTLVPLPSRWNTRRIWFKARSLFSPSNPFIKRAELLDASLWKTLTHLKPDILHAHFGPQGVIVGNSADKLRIPLFVSFYGYDVSRKIEHYEWNHIYKQMFRQMAVAVVLSNEMRRRVIDLGVPSDRVKLIHLGKKMKDYPFRLPRGTVKNWISVGRFVEKKGFFDCIEAFKIATRGSGAVLRLVGTGDLIEDVKTFVRQSAITDRVVFLGELEHDVVKRIMARSDAFILCSKIAQNGDKEGTPTVLMEAQAIGLPCVSTNHSGIPEVIAEENHWLLAEEGNVDGIAGRMKELINCSEEQLQNISIHGRRKIEKEFNIEKEARKLVVSYMDCLKQ
jgi:colanic acid/amylovoran biosynthesis glycosyltransferase